MKSRSDLMQRCYREHRRETAILNRWSVNQVTLIPRAGAVSLRFTWPIGIPLKLVQARQCPVRGSPDAFRPAT